MRIAQTLAAAAVALTTVCLTSCATQSAPEANPADNSWAVKMAHSHGLGDFDCNTKHRETLASTPWDYVGGLVAVSVLETWQQYPADTALINAVVGFANLATSTDGTEITKNGLPALKPSNIDDLAAARIFFGLYDYAVAQGDTANANRWKTAATMVRNKLKYDHNRIAEGLPGAGGFWHKMQYPNQMWLDGLFMGPAVYARWQAKWGAELGAEDNEQSWADIALQFKTLYAKTYDATSHLNFHGWSATPDSADSFWAKKDEPNMGCNAEVWARAMGWYTGALVDVLELMPKDHPDRAELLKMFRESADALIEHQDTATGLWYNLMRYDATVSADGQGDKIDGETYNVGTRQNYLESSASGMFAYVLMKGNRLGLLNEGCKEAGRRAFEGLLANKIVDEGNGKIGIKDICASAGLGPAKDKGRSGTINYYLEGSDTGLIKANEGKGVGTFILAALEYER